MLEKCKLEGNLVNSSSLILRTYFMLSQILDKEFENTSHELTMDLCNR